MRVEQRTQGRPFSDLRRHPRGKTEDRNKLSQKRRLKEALQLSRNPLREDVIALEPKGLIAIKVKNYLQAHEKKYYNEVMEQGEAYKPVGIRGATA